MKTKFISFTLNATLSLLFLSGFVNASITAKNVCILDPCPHSYLYNFGIDLIGRSGKSIDIPETQSMKADSLIPSCLNTNLSPDEGISLDFTNVSGVVQYITYCQYGGDYYGVTAVQPGSDYQFSSSDSSYYITVRSGSYDGPVVASGITPVNLIGASGADLFIHTNTDSFCGTDTICSASSVICTSCFCADPSYTDEPVNQTLYIGNSATFSVSVNGTPPFAFQWYKDFSPIPGATSSTYTTPKLKISDNGSIYFNFVTNCYGTKFAITDLDTITVTDMCKPVKITNQPTDQSATIGKTATFSVGVDGVQPIKYLWYKLNKTLSLIPGANSSSYTTPILSSDDNGSIYFCYITNCNESKSAVTVLANLTVTP